MVLPPGSSVYMCIGFHIVKFVYINSNTAYEMLLVVHIRHVTSLVCCSSARKHERQLVNFNGGVGKEQLSWLHKILTYADEQEEKVVIASHVPIHPNAQVTNCLAWNYSEILDVLHRHSCVVSYIAGHEHHGAYCQDSHGIHHITMEGVIESPPNTNAFATVHMYKNKMVLHGRGRVKSREMSFVQNGQ
ncbi:hypothetical protein XENTR_v10004451 [Xenopus tropicalis]|nr:hypothetical protein XENTR_v10004451 [Xenopus tropicalis]